MFRKAEYNNIKEDIEEKIVEIITTRKTITKEFAWPPEIIMLRRGEDYHFHAVINMAEGKTKYLGH